MTNTARPRGSESRIRFTRIPGRCGLMFDLITCWSHSGETRALSTPSIPVGRFGQIADKRLEGDRVKKLQLWFGDVERLIQG